jgi:hypothetical protein
MIIILPQQKDGDTVTEMAIQTNQKVQLTPGGMLLMALLGGGEATLCSVLPGNCWRNN